MTLSLCYDCCRISQKLSLYPRDVHINEDIRSYAVENCERSPIQRRFRELNAIARVVLLAQ